MEHKIKAYIKLFASLANTVAIVEFKIDLGDLDPTSEQAAFLIRQGAIAELVYVATVESYLVKN